MRPGRRAPTLEAKRRLKMARSAHAYVRGSTVEFYQWLESGQRGIPEGPPIWICGDCHVGNLGPLADAKGRVAVQIRDLDQTVIGNPADDLIRLALSLASAARGSDLPGVTTARILERMVEGYEAALNGGFEDGRDKSHRPRSIQKLLERSVRRRWRQLATEHLETVKPKLPLGKKFWPMTRAETAGLRELFAKPDIRAMVTGLKERADDSSVEMVDAAYWLKGCSSLGRLRFAAMLRIGEDDDEDFCLVDIKEATPAAAPRSPSRMPRDNAIRVVTGAAALSPNLGQRMKAARLLNRAVVLRELMPQDLKIEVDRLTADEATALAAYLAGVVGRAHGRQLDHAGRASWLKEMRRTRSTELDAPSWLWSSVVELISRHEAAYLDHCRRFALANAG